jgi:hypothetical protein
MAADAPARRQLRAARAGLREAAVAALILVATSQLLIENPSIPGALQLSQPLMIQAAVDYFRLNQGWAMFAPDAPRSDMWIVVDALTSDGRHIDPYNQRASRVADPSLRSIPARLGQAVSYCDYTVRLPNQPLYHEPFRDWLLRHHERTQRPHERIVHFDAYVVGQDSPSPGERQPSNVQAHVFLRY